MMDLKGARILLVDDTQANLDVLCQVLEREGYSISMAPNGEVALRIVGRVMPDLILLDVMMPGIDGFEVCRRLKADENTREIPVIFITAETDTTSVLTGFEAGGVDYILKPFRDEEVVVRAETHLKINHLSRELANKNNELSVANAQIQETTERKSRFLSSMAHELRTPMTSIMGYVDNMLEGIGGQLSERHEHVLGRVKENSDHLLTLVNDLLDLSKIEAGRVEFDMMPVKLKNLIESCADTVRPLVKDDVALQMSVDESLGEVCSDPSWLRQILMNLLSNAAKFTEKGQIDVAVALGENSNQYVVSVVDTGPGIPAEALDAIFEEFEQVKGSNKKHKGTGLGLAITKKLTELLGGTIRVESEVGKGSTFTVSLPIDS